MSSLASAMALRGLTAVASRRSLHVSAASAMAAASTAAPAKTCLFDFHVSHGGKMVDFAGYSMPVQYVGEGIAPSHLHTRKHCALFDVSHMLQTHIHGKDRIAFMESLTVADVAELPDNSGTLSVFTNDKGGIEDDLIVTKTDLPYLYLVTNAGCRDKDLKLLRARESQMKSQGKDVHLEVQEGRGLLALQGPESAKVLQALLKSSVDLSKAAFMTSRLADIPEVGVCRITRCGYTGEDGFEISVSADRASTLASLLLASTAGKVHLAGLGSRDSLRLEAGLCLYGNDIGPDTSPIEAGLAWTIGKRRRKDGDFPGASEVLRQLREKPSRRRVGIVCESAPARAHTDIVVAGNKVGEVTSGCPSPSLGTNVAMGYVPSDLAKPGTKVGLVIRKKTVEGTVVKMPFLKTNYFSL